MKKIYADDLFPVWSNAMDSTSIPASLGRLATSTVDLAGG